MALGVGHGAYNGEKTRLELMMMASRMAQNDRRAAENNLLRQRELNQRQQELNYRARERSWDNALKMQQMEKVNAELDLINERVKQLRIAGQEEDRQRENARRAAEGEEGAMVLAATQMGGFARNSMVNDYNKKNGTSWTAFGRTNPITGEQYKDGLYHYVREGKDKFGNRIIVENRTVDPAFTQAILTSEFGESVLNGSYGKSARSNLSNYQDQYNKDREYQLREARARSEEGARFDKTRQKYTIMDGADKCGKYKETDEEWEQKKKAHLDSLFGEEPQNNSAPRNDSSDPVSVYRGMLSVSGVDDLIAPNTPFKVNGIEYTWDGTRDGDLRGHIKRLNQESGANNNQSQESQSRSAPQIQGFNSSSGPIGAGSVSVGQKSKSGGSGSNDNDSEESEGSEESSKKNGSSESSSGSSSSSS